MSKVFKLEGTGFEVEIGGFADQADGAAWLKHGKNVVLATAVYSKKETIGASFFPLSVEFRTRPVSAGKFPGGFIKREGRLSDKEVLSSRIVDRGIRPFFPEGYMNEVQVISSLLSADGDAPAVAMGILASSIAINISGVPFRGPVGGVVICKNEGQWVVNTDYNLIKNSTDSIVVSGNADGICMVEGQCGQIQEEELLKALELAYGEIKKQIEWQESIIKELGVKQDEFNKDSGDQELINRIKDAFPKDVENCFFAHDKDSINEKFKLTREKVYSGFSEEIESGAISADKFDKLYQSEFKKIVSASACKLDKRIDGRKFDQVRAISAKVGILPCAHGSAMFRRGETNALSTIALGTPDDAQKEDSLFEGKQVERNFMIHYNFPPYSTGEVRPIRGVGRREIGHGYLAERSFYGVLPDQDKFPYTVRSVVDILECFGSSSMATVCATTLSLMDAGVPISDMVAGIAMGLLKGADGQYKVMSDISGAEDALGLMDFKVVGTDKGITSFQMDVKAKDGIPWSVLSDALKQAKHGRLHILSEMQKTLDKPREDVSSEAPQVTLIKINKEDIGALIGPGGKNIKEIVAETESQVDVSDDGTVRIYSSNAELRDKAVSMVKAAVGKIAVGDKFAGQIRGVTDFGVFVGIPGGKDGLIHVSSMTGDLRRDFDQKSVNIGDKLEVIVKEYDQVRGRIKLVVSE